MAQRNFIKFFVLTICLVALILALMLQLDMYKNYLDLSISSLLLYICLTYLLHRLAEKAIQNPDRTKFISLTVVNLSIKMFSSIALLVIYFKWTNPPNSNFVHLFLVVYIMFTIFETFYLLKVSEGKS